MNSPSQASSLHPLDAPAACIGFDWGDSVHAIALHVPGQPIETLQLDHSPERLIAWLDSLQERFRGAFVDIAIECTRGAVVYCCQAYHWIRIFPVHPTTSSKQRTAFRPSGAKDDTHDALVLLDILLNHRDRLRQLHWDEPDTRLIAELVAARRKAVDRRTLLSNQLTSTLKDYFPQALGLFGDNPTAPIAIGFLRKWPTLIDLQASSDAVISRFYRQHNVRSETLIKERIQAVRQSKSLTLDEPIVSTRSRVAHLLVDEIEVVQSHIAEFDSVIAAAFARHGDHAIFHNLPGAGAVMAPRLLAAFGSDRSRFPKPEDAQRLFGVAPVTESSGQRSWVHWRYGAPRFLRQSLVEWAGQSILYSAWAKAHYEQQRKGGSSRSAALRSLAYKWVRILWKCWTTRTLYSEKHYLAQLVKRSSPIAPRALELAQEMGL